MRAPSRPATVLLYRRHGRKLPKPGTVRAPVPKSDLFEREYGQRLTSIVRAWSDHVETLARAELRADALADDLRAAFRALLRASGLEPWLRRSARGVATRQAKYVERVANIPVGNAVPQALLEEFLQDNVSLVTNMAERQIQQIADIVRPAQAGGQRWEEVAKQIQERLSVSESRAKLIARDQANKFNSAMQQTTQTAAGVEEYEWTVAGDYAVRGRPGGEYEDSKEDHWVLKGRIFRWDNPPLIPGTSERAHPGQRIQCRCTARPVIRDLFDQRPAPERPAEIVAQERRYGFSALPPTDAGLPGPIPSDLTRGGILPFRPESFAHLRAGGGVSAALPVTVRVYPDNSVFPSDGRHRISIARERGEKFVTGNVETVGPRGGIRLRRNVRIPI